MPGYIKNSGTWRTISSPRIKVAGTWRTVTTGWVRVAGTWRLWFVSLINDAFTRTTSGGLGTSTSGHPWQAIRGTWFANGTQAQTSDAASTYPIAVHPIANDATVSATDIANGAGLALWVTDSGNWWAVAHQREDTTSTYYYDCNCQTCQKTVCTSYTTGYYSCNCEYCYGYRCTGYALEMYNCNCGGCDEEVGACVCDTCSRLVCTGYAEVLQQCNCQTCEKQVCDTSETYYYSCNCQTCSTNSTTNNYFLRLLRSVANAVSQVASVSLGTTRPTALRAITSGLTITAKSYSDSALTTQVGTTLTHTATSGAAAQHGIALTPSPAGQGNTLDNFNATTP